MWFTCGISRLVGRTETGRLVRGFGLNGNSSRGSMLVDLLLFVTAILLLSTSWFRLYNDYLMICTRGSFISSTLWVMKIEVVTGFFRRFWLELPTAEVAATAEAAAAKETACDEATEGKQSFAPSRSD